MLTGWTLRQVRTKENRPIEFLLIVSKVEQNTKVIFTQVFQQNVAQSKVRTHPYGCTSVEYSVAAQENFFWVPFWVK